jgi:hypothetical protein
MSKGRRALLRKLLDQRKQRKVSWISLKLPSWAWDTPLFATLEPGEVRRVTPSESWMGTPSWIGRSEDGMRFYQTLGAVVQGRRQVTEEEIIIHVREQLAAKVAEAASRPKNPKSNPCALGDRTEAPTRWTKCSSCGLASEVPAVFAEGTSRCEICGGGL